MYVYIQICLHRHVYIYIFSYPGAQQESKIRKSKKIYLKSKKMSFADSGKKPFA